MLTHRPRLPESPLYLTYGSEDGGNLTDAETLEMGEAYNRKSLELVRTTRIVPIYADLVSNLVFPCHDY